MNIKPLLQFLFYFFILGDKYIQIHMQNYTHTETRTYMCINVYLCVFNDICVFLHIVCGYINISSFYKDIFVYIIHVYLYAPIKQKNPQNVDAQISDFSQNECTYLPGKQKEYWWYLKSLSHIPLPSNCHSILPSKGLHNFFHMVLEKH